MLIPDKDYRVLAIAELIEYLKDRKYHIKPIEIAREVVKLVDDLDGKSYAYKIKEYLDHEKSFRGKV
jgi:hypothetical protein